MAMSEKHLDGVYVYSDALKALEGMIKEKQELRDSMFDGRFYSSWDDWHRINDQVTLLQEVLANLMSEPHARIYINKGAE